MLNSAVELRIKGVVQGVGFRPFVYQLATARTLTGWVLNDDDGVHVSVQGDSREVAAFIDELPQRRPPLASIESIEVSTVDEDATRTGFSILPTRSLSRPGTYTPVDSHVCADCHRELFDATNRRFGYPFINCTHCGPRFSIIRSMPYDRASTTMAAFTMCAPCQAEYDDPLDRRYHAQPNACADCGPRLRLRDSSGATLDTTDPIGFVIRQLIEGRIVAIKGVGGFHLAANPMLADAVERLRIRKRRDWKAFALMARDARTAALYAHQHPIETGYLEDPARPIVLMSRRHDVANPIVEAVAPGNPLLGFMLPSTPLHHLLLADERLVTLVMTSGNLSGEPICYGDDEAVEGLRGVADYVLGHDREIHNWVDDSVLRVTDHPELEWPIVTYLRRSRGAAPTSLRLPGIDVEAAALGAELKSTVAVTRDSVVFVSQHIGDLKNDRTYDAHVKATQALLQLNNVSPQVLVRDLHPQFRSSLAASRQSLPVVSVQHHHAHMAACMIDNGLVGDTLGVVFDGTGYGTDGEIWGGEFLIGDCADVERVAHLRPIALPGGDLAVQEPARTGVSLFVDCFGPQSVQAERYRGLAPLAHFTLEQRTLLGKMVDRGINSPRATSVGRLMDGFASLLGLVQVAEYEGHGPIALEGLLGRKHELAEPYRFELEARADGALQVDFRRTVADVVREIERGRSVASISRRIHSTLVRMIVETCIDLRDRFGINQVVLSGGVFINEFLVVNAQVQLRSKGFRVCAHKLFPPNDGGIAVGQLAVASARLRRGVGQPAVSSNAAAVAAAVES